MDILLKKRIMRRVYLVWFARSVYAKLAVFRRYTSCGQFAHIFRPCFSNTVNASSGFCCPLNI